MELKRVNRACDFCRTKKSKCTFEEGKQRCFNCIAYNTTCEMTTPKKRVPKSNDSNHLLEQRIEHIEKRIKQAHSKKSATNLFDESSVLGPRQWPSGVTYDNIHYLGDISTIQFFYDKIRLDNSNKLQGHTLKKFKDGVVLITDPGLPSQQSSKIPGFEWPQNIHPVGEDIHKYIYTVTGLDRYTAVRLLKLYFSHVHPILPVIDKTEFIKQYRDRVQTYPSGELLNAMFGAAARWVECESLEQLNHKQKLPSDAVWDVPIGWSNHFFDQAEYIITTWSSPPTVSNVQAIILILNLRGDRESRSSECWQLGGYAIRVAHLLGLHRSCEDWDIPRNEKETRKRVWWALYITDRFQTAILGRPLNLRDEDMSVPYPDAGADIEEVLDAYEADKDKILNHTIFPRFPCLTAPYNYETDNPERPQLYELFIQFIKLSQILGRILQGLHTPMAKKFSSQHGSDELVSRLDYELTEWRYNFPEALKRIQLPDFHPEQGHFAPVIASMLMFYCSCLIFLHQPFIKRTQQSKSSSTSQQICSSAATRGMKIASTLSPRDFLMCPYSFTLYPIRQFGLILMFNSKNPDPRISSSAEMYLKQGKLLLDNIKYISSTATGLYHLFNEMADTSSCLQEDDDDDDQEEPLLDLSNQTNDRQTMTSIMDAMVLQPSIDTLSSNISIIPQPLNIEADAFSLTQFGYNTPHDTSSLDYILQNMNWIPGLSSNDDPTLLQETTHLFRSEPNNVFWELPPTMDGLNEWIDSMNENGWFN